MSRGPGRIERAIKAVFDAEPTRVFTTEHLCAQVYAGVPAIEKKHRVSLIRAAKHVIQRERNWRMTRTHMPGAPFLFFNGAIADSVAVAGPHGIARLSEGDETRRRVPLEGHRSPEL